jgi:hypothetical protein
VSADEIVERLIERIAVMEHERGIKLDWMSYLSKDKPMHSARDVVNAMGECLTANGIPNNLYTDTGERT